MCQCLQLCFEKYLNNDYFISYYGLMFIEGIFGIVIILNIEVIKFYYNSTQYFLIGFNLFVNGKYYIIFSIITCIDLLFLIFLELITDFEWLHNILYNLFVGNIVPQLSKKNVGDKFNEELIHKRLLDMKMFSDFILAVPLVKKFSNYL